MSENRELTRAEIVRRRRSHQQGQAGKHLVKPLPPVTSRAAIYTGPKHKRVENHRRFNIAVGFPDVRLQQHAVPRQRRRLGWRIASLFLTGILGTALYFAWTLPTFRTSTAVILGNTRLTSEEINAVLGIAGESIFMLQPDQVENRLRLNYPELASASVYVYLPNHVYVSVTERTPVILWQQGEGYTWIDSSGVAFRPRGLVAGLVPVIGLAVPPAGTALINDPLSPPPYLARELVDAILVLASNLPAGTPMTYDPIHGLGWNDNRGWQVSFGTSAHDMALKVRVYQSLVDSLMRRGMYPVFINVAYPDAPYYRMAELEGVEP
jgi:hypothetical protein